MNQTICYFILGFEHCQYLTRILENILIVCFPNSIFRKTTVLSSQYRIPTTPLKCWWWDDPVLRFYFWSNRDKIKKTQLVSYIPTEDWSLFVWRRKLVVIINLRGVCCSWLWTEDRIFRVKWRGGTLPWSPRGWKTPTIREAAEIQNLCPSLWVFRVLVSNYSIKPGERPRVNTTLSV